MFTCLFPLLIFMYNHLHDNVILCSVPHTAIAQNMQSFNGNSERAPRSSLVPLWVAEIYFRTLYVNVHVCIILIMILIMTVVILAQGFCLPSFTLDTCCIGNF